VTVVCTKINLGWIGLGGIGCGPFDDTIHEFCGV